MLVVMSAVWISSAVAIDFQDYDDDVAALLREYQSQSDAMGSYNPSVLSFNETDDSNTLVDFEKGLILVAATTPEMLRQSIIDVLLTQIAIKPQSILMLQAQHLRK